MDERQSQNGGEVRERKKKRKGNPTKKLPENCHMDDEDWRGQRQVCKAAPHIPM